MVLCSGWETTDCPSAEDNRIDGDILYLEEQNNARKYSRAKDENSNEFGRKELNRLCIREEAMGTAKIFCKYINIKKYSEIYSYHANWNISHNFELY